jgi:hypothetical protein
MMQCRSSAYYVITAHPSRLLHAVACTPLPWIGPELSGSCRKPKTVIVAASSPRGPGRSCSTLLWHPPLVDPSSLDKFITLNDQSKPRLVQSRLTTPRRFTGTLGSPPDLIHSSYSLEGWSARLPCGAGNLAYRTSRCDR